MVAALGDIDRIGGHIISKMIKPKFIISSVSNVCSIGFFSGNRLKMGQPLIFGSWDLYIPDRKFRSKLIALSEAYMTPTVIPNK